MISLDLRAGQRIDHYTLLEPLGEGGQGSVWKVLDPRDGGVMRALKIVSLAETGTTAFERAQREARILAARGRNIPSVIVIDTEAVSGTGAGGHWWDVAVPQVGGPERLGQARERYATKAALQRVFN